MLCRAVEREQSTIGSAADLEVCRRGYVEPTALTKAIREVSLGRLEQTYALIRLFSLERWLRSLGRITSQRLALKKSSEAEAFRSSGIPMSLSGWYRPALGCDREFQDGERTTTMYKKPIIQQVGEASRLVQTKTVDSGDGTNAGFSRVQMSPLLEVVGNASELVQAHIKGSSDGTNAAHSLVQCSPALET
jgi:hypothetical protein